MAQTIVQRLSWSIITLLAIATITFFLMNMVPGGPFSALEAGRILPTAVVQQIERQYGLDKPLWEQYLIYLWNLLHGEFGRSLVNNEEVLSMLRSGLPASLRLGISSIVISLAVGLPLGVAAAVRRNSIIDYFATGISIFSVAVPSFVLGLILIIVVAVNFRWLPVSGWGSWKHAILPIIALSMEPTAYIIRYTRSSMLEVLNELYITVARSKGLREQVIIIRHALKNAIIPVVTVIGLVVPRLLVGSFLIETVFAVPGTGRFFVISITQRDYPVIMAMAILYGWIVVGVNVVVDLVYQYLDPRIQYT